jgi:hypothetical protein
MNTPHEPTTEKTPDEVPTPPKPSPARQLVRLAGIGLGTGVCVLAGAAMIGLFTPTRHAGASHSLRLKQDLRQAEVNQTVQSIESEPVDPKQP